ncbi:hypothetical protein BDV12DRAFT_160507 [Aspergillus spectabilis]
MESYTYYQNQPVQRSFKLTSQQDTFRPCLLSAVIVVVLLDNSLPRMRRRGSIGEICQSSPPISVPREPVS